MERQPINLSFAEIKDAAISAGLEIRYQPIIPGMLSDLDAKEFAALIAELPKPVLAYCRTGTRSASLWGAFGGSIAFAA